MTTHWMADCLSPDEWKDDPALTPEAAARHFLEGNSDNDEHWHVWDDLQKDGVTAVVVRRFEETTELIADPEEQFDGYEAGQPWYKKTEEVVEVMATLQFQILNLKPKLPKEDK